MVYDVTSVIYNGTYLKEYQGLSTDSKPDLLEENSGSLFFEADTSSIYTWQTDGWVEL